MDRFKAFLDKTECPFNWDLTQIDVAHVMPMVVKLREKIEEKEEIGEEETSKKKWPLKVAYAYELFSEDPAGAVEAVDEAIKEIKTSDEYLNVKYRVPFIHIALSTKACMTLKKGDKNRTKELVEKIKPMSTMTNEEVSAVLAMKAQMFRYYGPDGTKKSMAWLREAVRKNKKEVEWKISLVISLNRMRHVFKGTDIPWEEVEEPVNILEEVLCWPELTERQMLTCQFYLAVAYHDYCMGKNRSSEIDDCRSQVLRLCNSFYDKTNHPQQVTFAAERFAQSRGPEQHKAMAIIDKYLAKFPTHIGVRTTACKILKRRHDFAGAAKHAQIAMDYGGYGAAWLLLECKTELRQAIDTEAFFDDLLSKFQDMYKKQTHLSASLYYFVSKRDPVNGARHFEQALVEDPDNDQLRKPYYCYYAQNKVVPMELAYNQIVLSLRSHHSRDDELTLNSAKRRIQQVCDIQKFDVTSNLVDKALERRRNFGRRFR